MSWFFIQLTVVPNFDEMPYRGTQEGESTCDAWLGGLESPFTTQAVLKDLADKQSASR